MTEKQKYYLWFALIGLHLYDYTDGDISTVHLAGTRHIGAFHARECMHDHSEFIYS